MVETVFGPSREAAGRVEEPLFSVQALGVQFFYQARNKWRVREPKEGARRGRSPSRDEAERDPNTEQAKEPALLVGYGKCGHCEPWLI